MMTLGSFSHTTKTAISLVCLTIILACTSSMYAQSQSSKVLLSVQFGYNSDKLFPSSFPELNKVAQALKKQRNTSLTITGYVKASGSYGLRLAEKRASTVKQYIVDRGIEATRLNIAGVANAEGENTHTDHIEIAYGKLAKK